MRIARKYYYIRASVATTNSTRKKQYMKQLMCDWLWMGLKMREKLLSEKTNLTATSIEQNKILLGVYLDWPTRDTSACTLQWYGVYSTTTTKKQGENWLSNKWGEFSIWQLFSLRSFDLFCPVTVILSKYVMETTVRLLCFCYESDGVCVRWVELKCWL